MNDLNHICKTFFEYNISFPEAVHLSFPTMTVAVVEHLQMVNEQNESGHVQFILNISILPYFSFF